MVHLNKNPNCHADKGCWNAMTQDSSLMMTALQNLPNDDRRCKEESDFIATMGRKKRDRRLFDAQWTGSNEHADGGALAATQRPYGLDGQQDALERTSKKKGIGATPEGGRPMVAQILAPKDDDPPPPRQLCGTGHRGKGQFCDGNSGQTIDIMLRQNPGNFRFTTGDAFGRKKVDLGKECEESSRAGTRNFTQKEVKAGKNAQWHVEKRHIDDTNLGGIGVKQAFARDSHIHQAQSDFAKRSQSEAGFKELCSLTLQSKQAAMNASQTIKKMMNEVTMADALTWN